MQETKYTIYATEDAAKAVSAEEALNKGCDMVTTTHWWAWFVHPITGETALADNMGTTTHQELVEGGWFPEEHYEET